MSEKTLAQKLLIKTNYRVLLVNEPEAYRPMLGSLLANVTIFTGPNGPCDLVQFFVASR